ncbi:MAG TPA: DMT family transporter [Candidatus Acidoferrum sp.]|nr:DMT family transporter [Candidatus Acidoferrum sp.]
MPRHLHDVVDLLDDNSHAAPQSPMMPANRTPLAYLALIAAILCIGWSAIFVRWTDIPGSVSAFYRMLIPAVLLVPTFLIGKKAKPPSRRSLGIIALGGIFFAGDLALFNSSILQTTAANATLLGNNSPIFVGLLTWLVFRRPPRASFWIGLVMAVCGSLVILRSDLLRHTQFGWGDAMAVGAAAFFAMYLLATEQVRTTTGTLQFLRLAMISTTVALLVINLALRNSFRVPNARTWGALIGLGLISQLAGYLALTYALGHLPATVTSVSLLTQGPLTAVLAALLLHETLSAAQVAGGILVLVGVGVAHRQKHPEEEANI